VIAASGGDPFLSGVLVGIATGFLVGLVFRAVLVWRIRSRAWAEAARRTQMPTDRVATNGHASPQRLPDRPFTF
jgi:hypothetical protein